MSAFPRKRVTIVALLASSLSLSLAHAQADRSWMDSAYDRAQRLSLPWNLPLGPELLPSQAAAGESTGEQDLGASEHLVLDLPWRERAAGPTVLTVTSVDVFEDPWADETTSAPEDELVDPWPIAEEGARSRAAAAESERATDGSPTKKSWASTPDPELSDPWLE